MTPAIVMHNKGTGRAVRRACACGLIALAAGAASGCGDATRQGQSPAYIQIKALNAASGAKPDEFGTTLHSDVVTLVDDSPIVYNDFGQVTMTLALRDPGPAGLPNAPSVANFVTIERYRVRYYRADGRDTPGVFVPYAFDGAMNMTVGKDEVTTSFEVVRHTAKREAPLAALASSLVIINTFAEVTFYGHDQTGREVVTVGTLGVNFGNFADPKS